MLLRCLLFHSLIYSAAVRDSKSGLMRWRCPSVCLSVCRQNAKTRFSQKLSNLQLWCLLATYKKSYMGFSKNPILDPKIQDGGDTPSWKSTWRQFLFWRRFDLDKIPQTGAEWHVDCGDVVEIETRSRAPIWRTFWGIQWHVIQEPRATAYSAGWKNSICHIENRCSPYFIYF